MSHSTGTLEPSSEDILSHLKASLWQTISNILEEESQKLNVQYTPNFLAGLVQLVFDQLVSVSEDLNSFSHHANRKTIIPEDLFMIVRKNPHLLATMKESLQEMKNRDKRNTYSNVKTNVEIIDDEIEETAVNRSSNDKTSKNDHIDKITTNKSNDKDFNNDILDDDFDDNFDFNEIDKKLKQ